MSAWSGLGEVALCERHLCVHDRAGGSADHDVVGEYDKLETAARWFKGQSHKSRIKEGQQEGETNLDIKDGAGADAANVDAGAVLPLSV